VPAFLYRCPVTNLTVQGWAAEEIAHETLTPIKCIACQRTHLVDPKTGKLQREGEPPRF